VVFLAVRWCAIEWMWLEEDDVIGCALIVGRSAMEPSSGRRGRLGLPRLDEIEVG
jgi:hypothetical protein